MTPRYTQQEIDKYYGRLPLELKDQVLSAENAQKLYEIGRRHGLTVEQTGFLAEETGFVIIGLARPQMFVQMISQRLGVDSEKARDIATAVNHQVFYPLRELFKQVHQFDISPDEMQKVPPPQRPLAAPPVAAIPAKPVPHSPPPLTPPLSKPPAPPPTIALQPEITKPKPPISALPPIPSIKPPMPLSGVGILPPPQGMAVPSRIGMGKMDVISPKQPVAPPPPEKLLPSSPLTGQPLNPAKPQKPEEKLLAPSQLMQKKLLEAREIPPHPPSPSTLPRENVPPSSPPATPPPAPQAQKISYDGVDPYREPME